VDAPIAGVTGRALQSIGSLVAPNADSSLLTTLTRTDPIWVRFALSEAEFASLRARDPKQLEVKLLLDNGTAFPTSGKLNFSGSTVDASLGTVQMRAEFANPTLQLLPGQYVKVQVVAGSQQAVLVPQSAVLQNEGGRFVWLVGPENKAQVRNIRPGSWIGKDWVVLDGLKAGDSVIVDNLVRLRPGTPVEIKPIEVKTEAKK
jgi:membrane fusion protein (multidrug efflux system)